MYIRRKVFSRIQDENGEIKLFAKTRKQNRKLARAQHNSEMHTNKAAKKAKKAQEAVLKGDLEQAEVLTKSAEKANRAAQIDANRAADEVAKISKTRKSAVTNPEGLKISNQGAGELVVSKQGDVVTKAPKSSGQSTSTVKVTRKSSPVKSKVGFEAKVPEVIIESPKGKILNDERLIKAGKFIEKNKKPLMVAAAATTAATLGGVAYKK